MRPHLSILGPISPERLIWRAFCFCSLCVLFLIGCVNLDQITDLTKIADEARPVLPVVANDFKGSCDRQNLYVHLPPPPAPPPLLACVNRDDLGQLGKNLIVEQSVLLDYFDALGKLASKSPLAYQKTVSDLGTSFKTAGLGDAQQKLASSAGKLVAAISEIAVQGYRKREVSKILQQADPDVQILAKGLADQVAGTSTTSYLSLLQNEDLLMRSYYDGPLAKEAILEQQAEEAQQKSGGASSWQPSPNPLSAMLVRREYQSEIDRLISHKEAAPAYKLLMTKLAEAHAKLAGDTKNGHFDIKQLGKDLGPDVTQMKDAISELQKDLR